MMKSEFEAIAKRTVTSEQYQHIEALYMASDLDKYEFVKSIKSLLKTIPEEKKERFLVMAVHNKYGEMLTPNHAYVMTYKVRLISVDIRTGKKFIEVIPDSFDYRTSYDLTDWDYGLVVRYPEE